MHLDELKGLLQHIQDLSQEEEPESQPYEHKYAAASALQEQIARFQAEEEAAPGDDERGLQLAVLRARRGVVLLDTDLLHEGEADLHTALKTLEASVTQHLDHQRQLHQQSRGHSVQGLVIDATLVLQQAYNALAALWCNRGDWNMSLTWLTKAEQLYTTAHQALYVSKVLTTCPTPPLQCAAADQHTPSPLDTAPTDCSLQPAATLTIADASEGPELAPACKSHPVQLDLVIQATLSGALEAAYTTTLFYLAQVHGHAGSKEKSAAYCGATLQRQLDASQHQVSEWVQNALQLACYYTSSHSFAYAMHCLHAAEVVGKLVASGEVTLPASAVASVPTAPATCGSTPVPAATSTAGITTSTSAPASTVTTAGRPAQAVVCELAPDVQANVHLAWAKLYRQRLAQSQSLSPAERCEDAQQEEVKEHPGWEDTAQAATGPEFKCLAGSLPALSALPVGRAALASDFASARDLFNKSMQHYNKALEYYLLDGWVTEHVNILLEVSSIYKQLAAWEPLPARRAAMHKQRTVRLAPVAGEALNRDHYLGLWRAVELEVGHAWRDVVEARTECQDELPTPKEEQAVAAAAKAAVQHYGAYVQSFMGLGQQQHPPARIADDDEPYFLVAAFALGRMLYKCSSSPMHALTPGDHNYLVAGLKFLRWSCDYVRHHDVRGFSQEAALCAELAGLIGEKIKLHQRISANGASAR